MAYLRSSQKPEDHLKCNEIKKKKYRFKVIVIFCLKLVVTFVIEFSDGNLLCVFLVHEDDLRGRRRCWNVLVHAHILSRRDREERSLAPWHSWNYSALSLCQIHRWLTTWWTRQEIKQSRPKFTIGNREWGSIRELNPYFFFSSFSLNKLIVVLYGTILDCLYYLLSTPYIESSKLERY